MRAVYNFRPAGNGTLPAWRSLKKGGSMIERLGNVIYWLGVLLAAICVAIAFWSFISLGPGSHNRLESVVIAGIFAAIFFGTGWAVRYVLAGR
jgi:hypothetical protein